MPSFTDWLARTFYTDPNAVATSNQVADAQQAIVAGQVASGERSIFSGSSLNAQIDNSRLQNTSDQTLGSAGATGMFKDILGGGTDSGINDPNVNFAVAPDGSVTTTGKKAGGFNLFGSIRSVLILAVLGVGVYLFIQFGGWVWLKKKFKR